MQSLDLTHIHIHLKIDIHLSKRPPLKGNPESFSHASGMADFKSGYTSHSPLICQQELSLSVSPSLCNLLMLWNQNTKVHILLLHRSFSIQLKEEIRENVQLLLPAC